ncbi:hypothetical protein BD413DRAFT_515099 [Trametes elegans]|nr:hypothetical protein BD413DRAFT_515099 [Trametes elegans]
MFRFASPPQELLWLLRGRKLLGVLLSSLRRVRGTFGKCCELNALPQVHRSTRRHGTIASDTASLRLSTTMSR